MTVMFVLGRKAPKNRAVSGLRNMRLT